MVAIHDFIKTNDLDCDSKRCQTVDVFYDPVQWEAAQESVALVSLRLVPLSNLIILQSIADQVILTTKDGQIHGYIRPKA